MQVVANIDLFPRKICIYVDGIKLCVSFVFENLRTIFHFVLFSMYVLLTNLL